MMSLTDKELLEKDERLRLALTSTGLGTWEMDLVNNLRHWSDETFALHGLSRTPATDEHLELNDQVMHPDDRIRLVELHNELRRGRDDYFFEYRTTLPNGSERWISARGKVLERQAEGPTRIVGVTADVTDQKRRRQVQEQQDVQFRLLADALPQLVWVADSRGRVSYYNQRRQLYYQEPHADASDKQWQPLIHPDDLKKTIGSWARAMQSGQEYEMEHRLRMVDGQYRWHLSRATPLLDVYGQVVTWFGTATDIARLKEAEVHIQAGEDRLLLATEAAGMFAWEVDLKTGKIDWADNAADILGCSQEYLSRDETEAYFFVHPDDRQRISNEFDGYLTSGADRFEMSFRGWPATLPAKHWRTAGKFIRDASGVAERGMGVTQDVTLHAEVAARLKLLDERLATAEEGAGALVYDWDLQTDHVWRSNGLKVVLGWEPHELESNSKAWHKLMHPNDLARLSAAKPSGSVNQDDHYIAEYRMRHRDGRYRWMIDSGRVFRDEVGSVIRQTGTTLDITERKQLEMSAQRMARLIDMSFEPIFVWHPQNGIMEWNRGAELLYGYTRTEALGRLPQNLLRTCYPVATTLLMTRLFADHNWSGELQNFDKAGKLVDVESRYQVIQFDNDMMVLESNRDIRERKRGEDNMARIAAVAVASHDALYGADLEGIIETWNPGAHRLFGYSENEAIGQHISLLAENSHHAEQLVNLKRVASGETVDPFDTVRMRKDGTLIDVSIAIAPVKAGDNRILGISVALHDIGERKEWEKRQRFMNRELAHRVKNAFAILQAILRSTLQSTPNPAEFASAFSGRLHSMAAAHDVLTENDWRGAELSALLRHQLSHYVTGQRIGLSGGVLNLAAEHAAPFSLIFNELATNSVKYGALSVPQGRIDVSWLVDLTPKGQGQLVLTWRESGGPAVRKQGKRGFGTTLIEKSLANAVVTMAFEPEGLHCTLTWPITKSGMQLAAST